MSSHAIIKKHNDASLSNTFYKISNKRDGLKTRFVLSQLILFQSRKKWGIVYSFATLVGFLCVIGNSLVSSGLETEDLLASISNAGLLSSATFMMAIGMYVFNDLVDSDIDRSNGKKCPIPAGQVSKKDAWVFIIITNIAGFVLASITFNIVSIIITLMMVAIGLMYSAPRVALKDRFLLKTLSIAIAMMLCATLGYSASWNVGNTYHRFTLSRLIVPAHAFVMLGAMIFVTSPVSDAADITGDKLVGRHTIPIVIGMENTMKMSILIVTNMCMVSWLLYSLHTVGLITAVSVSVIAIMIMADMIRNLKELQNREYVSDPRKRTVPLHMILQAGLVVGAVTFQTSQGSI